MPAPAGPARFFARHPVLHALSVAAAAGAAVSLGVRAVRAEGPLRKAGWGLLSLLEWGVVAGLLALPRDGEGDGLPQEVSASPAPTF